MFSAPETELIPSPVFATFQHLGGYVASKIETPIAERISATFPKLRSAAKALNTASDELARAVAPIESVLKALNIGVPT